MLSSIKNRLQELLRIPESAMNTGSNWALETKVSAWLSKSAWICQWAASLHQVALFLKATKRYWYTSQGVNWLLLARLRGEIDCRDFFTDWSTGLPSGFTNKIIDPNKQIQFRQWVRIHHAGWKIWIFVPQKLRLFNADVLFIPLVGLIPKLQRVRQRRRFFYDHPGRFGINRKYW